MDILGDNSPALFEHSLGCCEGCNIKKIVQPVEDSKVQIEILKTVIELEALEIKSITEKKILNFLKGVPNDIISKGNNNIEAKLSDGSIYGSFKKGLSREVPSVAVKQCLARDYLESNFYVYARIAFHKVNVSTKGKSLISNPGDLDLPNPVFVCKFINKVMHEKVQTQIGESTSSQPQKIVEHMLHNPTVPILTADQYRLLGFRHDHWKLLYTPNVENVEGYPRGGKDDFMWFDLAISKKTPVKPLTKNVSVRHTNEELIKELVFMKARCNSVKKCSNNSCNYVCSPQKVVNQCSKHGETAGG